MKDIFNDQSVKNQYKTDKNLNTRTRLHEYNINKIDWDNWCFNQIKFPDNAKILELGCGDGSFWDKNRKSINTSWSITLSDFSDGMLDSAKKKLGQTNFLYRNIDVQNIPFIDKSFDIVVARHMLYHVPDIEKSLSEIKRVLVKDGIFYTTTNSHDTMNELHVLIEKFDSEIGLNNCGMGDKFNMEGGQILLKKYFKELKTEIFEEKLVVPIAEPIVSYVASTIRGRTLLTYEKKMEFTRYIENYIKKNGSITINTKACIFKAKNI